MRASVIPTASLGAALNCRDSFLETTPSTVISVSAVLITGMSSFLQRSRRRPLGVRAPGVQGVEEPVQVGPPHPIPALPVPAPGHGARAPAQGPGDRLAPPARPARRGPRAAPGPPAPPRASLRSSRGPRRPVPGSPGGPGGPGGRFRADRSGAEGGGGAIAAGGALQLRGGRGVGWCGPGRGLVWSWLCRY